jgi:hypothetical protein
LPPRKFWKASNSISHRILAVAIGVIVVLIASRGGLFMRSKIAAGIFDTISISPKRRLCVF